MKQRCADARLHARPVAVSNPIEKRREARAGNFLGEFPGWLVPTEDENRTIKIRPIDVSRRGLGFLAEEKLPPGSFYWLMIDNQKVRVELAYCNNHLGIDNLFRCGLFLREAEGDLVGLCRAIGIIGSEDS